MYILMSQTANTVLSMLMGIVIGGIGMAWWYASHKKTINKDYDFEEYDPYWEKPQKKVS